MRKRKFRTRLLPPVLIAASVLIGLGCGVVNPNLLSGPSAATGVTGIDGNIVIMVVNNTTVTAQANATVTKENGGQLVLNMPVAANEHLAVVQDCSVRTIQGGSASYAGTAGAVIIPATFSPIQMGLTLQCGGVVVISITGAPPGVFLNVQTFF